MRFSIVALALIPSILALPADATPLTAEHAVVRARDAIGWERVARHAGAVRVRGNARLMGTDAVQTEWFDRHGRSLQTFQGALAQSQGFDGKTAWMVDWTGTPRVLELANHDDARVSAALLSGAWTDPVAGFAFDEVSVAGEHVTVGFRHGTVEGHVVLDARTWLPRTATWTSSGPGTTWTFESHEDHDGFRFPRSITLEASGVTQSLSTGSVELVNAEPSIFTARLDRPRDTTFDPKSSPTLEVKRVKSGHLLVHPTVNGEDLGWFIFDTGAGTNCISTEVAERLGPGFGEVPAQGVGGTVVSGFRRAKELSLGPVTVAEPIFMELDLGFLEPHFGVPVGGILGYELLSRSVVELDIAGAAISLHDPRGYELPTGGQWEEALLYNRTPNIRAAFEGHEGVFLIDTGAAGDTLTMHYPTVEALDLLKDRETRESRSGGVGGQVVVREGRIGSFRIAGRDLGAVDASFATEAVGAFGNRCTAGQIGGKLIAPFVLVFDYGHKRIGFLRREPVS